MVLWKMVGAGTMPNENGSCVYQYSPWGGNTFLEIFIQHHLIISMGKIEGRKTSLQPRLQKISSGLGPAQDLQQLI